MAKASDELGVVLQKVFRAEAGELSREEEEDLKSLLAGVFGHGMNNPRIKNAVEGGDWHQVEGLLRRLMCDIDATSGASTLNVESNSSANASAAVAIDLGQLLDIERAIHKSPELTDEQKDTLAALLREVVTAAQEQKPKNVADKLKDWLEVAANTTTVAQVLASLLVQIGSLLAS